MVNTVELDEGRAPVLDHIINVIRPRTESVIVVYKGDDYAFVGSFRNKNTHT
jgi:hypothetical protein